MNNKLQMIYIVETVELMFKQHKLLESEKVRQKVQVHMCLIADLFGKIDYTALRHPKSTEGTF